MIIETIVLLAFAGACFVGVPLSGQAAIEGWHLEHTAIRGVVTHLGPCERNEDDVECPGRFTSSDGRLVDRAVTLNTWRPDPAEPVHARLAGLGYSHVWADDATQQPSTRGGLIGVVVFSALTALCAAPVVLAWRTYRRRGGGQTEGAGRRRS
jgi:hypothetical protein